MTLEKAVLIAMIEATFKDGLIDETMRTKMLRSLDS